MSAIIERYGTDSQGRAIARPFEVDVLSFAEAETDWRTLERDGLLTPYQRYEWASSFAEANADRVRAVLIRDDAGRAAALLPLAIVNRLGLSVARFIGGKHANFHMPVMRRSFAETVSEAQLRASLSEAARALGVDAFLFRCQPVSWDGIANPFARLAAQPSPSQAYKLDLLDDCEATLQKSMSSHARKKHKNKRARFGELGASRLIIAREPQEKARVLEAFFRQKSLRFQEMGIPDPFADAGVRRFLAAAAEERQDSETSVRLYGLELNGAIVATYIGAVTERRFSGMATSYEPDPAVTKVSPGEILLIDLIRSECRAGRKVFDLGVGEARYKTTICDQVEELVDSFIGVTLKGRMAAAASRQVQAAKAYAKRHPALHALAYRVNAWRGGRTENSAA